MHVKKYDKRCMEKMYEKNVWQKTLRKCMTKNIKKMYDKRCITKDAWKKNVLQKCMAKMYDKRCMEKECIFYGVWALEHAQSPLKCLQERYFPL